MRHRLLNLLTALALLLCGLIGGCAGGRAESTTPPAGEGGVAWEDDALWDEVGRLEALGFAPRNGSKWRAEERMAIAVTWNEFLAAGGMTDCAEVVPRFKVDRTPAGFLVRMTWAALGREGRLLAQPAGAAVFVVAISSDWSRVRVLPTA